MKKQVRLTEEELHSLIKSKILDVLEHAVDLDYSPAIGNKKRGPGKNTMDQMRKRRNTRLDELNERGDYDYGESSFEDATNSELTTISLDESDYLVAYNEVTGRRYDENNNGGQSIGKFLEEMGVPDSIDLYITWVEKTSKGDYWTPGYTDYKIVDWRIYDKYFSRLPESLKNLVRFAVQAHFEDDSVVNDTIDNIKSFK